jgi:hypothetical protein
MDIDEVRSARTGLERKIAGLLEAFEEETSIQISGVSIETTAERNLFLDSRHIVKIEVIL